MVVMSLFEIVADLSFIQVASCLLAVLIFYRWYRRPNNFPPGPRGFPVVGTLPLLGQLPAIKLRDWSKKYGSAMSVRMGGSDWVILNDYETMQEALVRKKEAFSGRPTFHVIDQITEGHGVLFTDYGKRWKLARKFGAITLKGLGLGKNRMEEHTQVEAGYLNQAISERNEQPFDILGILTSAVSNNICSLALGKRFDYNDERFNRFLYYLGTTFTDAKLNAAVQILTFAPYLIHVPPFRKLNQQLKDDFQVVFDFLHVQISEHKETFDPDNPRDFIDVFLNSIDEDNDDHFTYTQLIQYLRDLFVAGTETATSTLRWAILCLIHYPHVQQKLFNEIQDVVGLEATVCLKHRTSMSYTCAFIEEVYRFRTLLPLSVTHQTNEDVWINGCFIPSNTPIAPNLWAVHNDPALFNEPEKFKPERHLDDEGNFVKSRYVIPFSVGPRHCLGDQMANMEIFIYIVSLIQKFRFNAEEGKQLPDINKAASGITFVPCPFDFIAKER